jgi:hypothetical protein
MIPKTNTRYDCENDFRWERTLASMAIANSGDSSFIHVAMSKHEGLQVIVEPYKQATTCCYCGEQILGGEASLVRIIRDGKERQYFFHRRELFQTQKDFKVSLN